MLKVKMLPPLFMVSSTYPGQSVRSFRQDDIVVADMVAYMEVDMVVDMVTDMEVDMVADMVTDMEVDMVADMVTNMEVDMDPIPG